MSKIKHIVQRDGSLLTVKTFALSTEWVPMSSCVPRLSWNTYRW